MKKEKNTKKNKKIEEETVKKDITETKLWSSFFIVLSVICFFCLFYLLTLYITRDDSKKDSDSDAKKDVEISSEKTIVGRSLSMKDGEYYVIFYDGSNEDVTGVYDSVVSNYRTNSPEMSIYYVDMSSSFNKSFSTEEESNKNPGSAAEFKINGPTLIKVSNHSVVEYYEGEGAIKNILE